MAKLSLTKMRIKEGVWHGELLVEDGQGALPQIEVRHLDQVIENVTLTQAPEKSEIYNLSVPIPAELLNDGVQTFVISNRDDGTRLSSFSILTGQAMQEDIRAEMDLLREELDMLKRAFRRHCVETM